MEIKEMTLMSQNNTLSIKNPPFISLTSLHAQKSRLEELSEILTIADTKNGASKKNLADKTQMTESKLNPLLKYALDRNLIEEKGSKYITTKKGQQLLKQMTKLTKYL